MGTIWARHVCSYTASFCRGHIWSCCDRILGPGPSTRRNSSPAVAHGPTMQPQRSVQQFWACCAAYATNCPFGTLCTKRSSSSSLLFCPRVQRFSRRARLSCDGIGPPIHGEDEGQLRLRWEQAATLAWVPRCVSHFVSLPFPRAYLALPTPLPPRPVLNFPPPMTILRAPGLPPVSLSKSEGKSSLSYESGGAATHSMSSP